jgi:GTP cyclohydrolase I
MLELKTAAPISKLPEPEPTFDLRHAQMAVRELLIALGEDPDREGLADTPRRVAKMYTELFGGREVDLDEVLGRCFDEASDEPVVLSGVQFASTCEHHLLPFIGTADVAYIPSDRVVGLSKLARTVHAFARRPQIQERMTGQIADALMSHLDARGALVIVRAQHLCMKVRGVNEPDSHMITTAARGSLKNSPQLRGEVTSLMRSR